MKSLSALALGAGVLTVVILACTENSPVDPGGQPVLTENMGGNPVARWAAPTTGSPVEHYRLRVIHPDKPNETYTDIPDTFFVVPYVPGDSIQVKTMGVDEQGRAGVWSAKSDWFYRHAKPDDRPERRERP